MEYFINYQCTEAKDWHTHSGRSYSDLSNNRTGTAIYFQKIILPIRPYQRMFFEDYGAIFTCTLILFWKICHPVRLLKTIRLLERSEQWDEAMHDQNGAYEVPSGTFGVMGPQVTFEGYRVGPRQIFRLYHVCITAFCVKTIHNSRVFKI